MRFDYYLPALPSYIRSSALSSRIELQLKNIKDKTVIANYEAAWSVHVLQ